LFPAGNRSLANGEVFGIGEEPSKSAALRAKKTVQLLTAADR
jgi:hypothetical protein